MKFEYWALAHRAVGIMSIQQLVRELMFVPPTALVLWCDNIGANSLAANLAFHQHTKHVEVYVHFFHDKVAQNDMEVRYTPTHDQMADTLMKFLPIARL